MIALIMKAAFWGKPESASPMKHARTGSASQTCNLPFLLYLVPDKPRLQPLPIPLRRTTPPRYCRIHHRGTGRTARDCNTGPRLHATRTRWAFASCHDASREAGTAVRGTAAHTDVMQNGNATELARRTQQANEAGSVKWPSFSGL